MTKGAQAVAKLTSIHLRGQLRTAPQDNFSADHARAGFCHHRVVEAVRADTSNGALRNQGASPSWTASPRSFLSSRTMPTKSRKPPPAPTTRNGCTRWPISAKPSKHELGAIKDRGWPVTLTQEQGADGKAKSVISVEAKSGLGAGDYLNNKFFSTADTRRDYVFDDQSELLQSVKVYLHSASGDQLVFSLDEIEYNTPIDPAVFQLQLPANVSIGGEMPVLPDNGKYAAMTSEQAARAMFEACGREDWTEAAKFFNPLPDSMKQYLGGLKVVSIGAHFTSAVSLISGAQFVPYEITLKNGETKKYNLSLKRDKSTSRWYFDGGL